MKKKKKKIQKIILKAKNGNKLSILTSFGMNKFSKYIYFYLIF